MSGRTPAGDSGTSGLVSAIQELSQARAPAEVHGVVTRAARRITAADGATLVVSEGGRCRYVAQYGLEPSLVGTSVPLDSCVSGWVMLHRTAVAVGDLRADRRVPPDGWGPPAARSLISVPLRADRPVGALTSYWVGSHTPAQQEVELLQALAEAAAVALENAAVRVDLEAAVRQRTAELEEVNLRLQREVTVRKRAEEEVRHMSLSDELTGLYNRRGFMLLAGREIKMLARTGRRALVLYIDLDGLKQANDTHGHEAGDRLILRAASVLRSVARETDVVGRLGGDEFAVFMSIGPDHPPLHRIVERFIDAARVAGVRWSVGATASVPGRTASLEDLLAGADEAMYRGRRARRDRRRLALVN